MLTQQQIAEKLKGVFVSLGKGFIKSQHFIKSLFFKKKKNRSASPSFINPELLREFEQRKRKIILISSYAALSVFLLLSATVAFINLSKPKIDQTAFIKANQTKITETILVVAQGQPIKRAILINKSDLTKTQYLLKLPKNAKNIKIKTISRQQADALVAQANVKNTQQLSSKERKQLSAASKQSNFFLGSLLSGLSKFFLSSVGDGVGQIIETITQPEISTADDSKVVDLSSQIPEEATTPTVEEVAPALTEIISAPETTSTEAPPAVEVPSAPEETPAIPLAPEISTTDVVEVTYETPAPILKQETTDTGKMVTVSSLNTEGIDCESLNPANKSNSPISFVFKNSIASLANAVSNILSTINRYLFADLEQAISQIVETIIAPAETSAPTEQPSVTETPTITQDTTSQSDASVLTPPSTEPETAPTEALTDEEAAYQDCLAKQVLFTDVVAHTNIPEIYDVGQESKIQVKLQNPDNTDTAVDFKAYDNDDNGKLDYLEWTISALSSSQTFKIVFTSKAFKLDEDKTITEDIYDSVKIQDGKWITIENNKYIKLTFSKELDATGVINIYTKPAYDGQSDSIDVYTQDGNQWIANLNNIDQEGSYSIPLSNLSQPATTFYLKISGDISFDYVSVPSNNLTVSSDPTTNAGEAPGWEAGSGGGNVNVDDINSALNSGKAVTLKAEGDITLNDPIAKTSGDDASLIITAGNSIVSNSSIDSTSDISLNSEDNENSSGRIEIIGELSSNGGRINLSSGVVMLDADANCSAGQVNISSRNILQQGTISAWGVNLNFSGAYIDSESSIVSGNTIYLNGSKGFASHIFASGKYDVSGDNGGNITLEAAIFIKLFGSKLNASGENQGGTIKIGGDMHGQGSMVQSHETVISPTTTLKANGNTGNGGTIVVWSDKSTKFDGLANAKSTDAAGGTIEISSSGDLSISPDAKTDASSEKGAAGTILFDPKNITISSSGQAPSGSMYYFELVDPNPDTGTYGQQIGYNFLNVSSTIALAAVPITNGNVPVADYGDDLVASNAGAVYLFNGETGALISTITGTTASDQVGSNSISSLTNGNYVIRSSTWDNGAVTDAGAVTWCSGTAGCSGTVSTSNSLVGSTNSDQMGSISMPTMFLALSNGNYVVSDWNWDNGAVVDAGGAILCNGATNNCAGQTMNTSNSLYGTTASDRIGQGQTFAVIEVGNGNYAISSTIWDNGSVANAGAVTWCNGTTNSCAGQPVSASNSLVGSAANDNVGAVLKTLTNGNYVVSSYNWDNGAATNAGAITWCSGATGCFGAVSTSNSLYGTQINDNVGSLPPALLTNGNYVVANYSWNNGATVDVGATTWCNGATGSCNGQAVSISNSLYGTTTSDQIGYFIKALSNGNYITGSPYWDNGGKADIGAVVLCNGETGCTPGSVTTSNSLYGSTASDASGSQVNPLTNGNYVVAMPGWNNGATVDAGAVTWCSGTTGCIGVVSTSNSLYGTTTSDQVGGSANGGLYITPLLVNGNYMVSSPFWDNGATANVGALVWCNGTTNSCNGQAVSTSNSIYGATANDAIGAVASGSSSPRVLALANGNFVNCSGGWDNSPATDVGATTFINGTTGTTGIVSSSNSLYGTTTSDGAASSVGLSNGNYVVYNANWDNGATVNAGEVTLCSGTTGCAGAISSSNSIIGPTASASMAVPRDYVVNNHTIVSFYQATAQKVYSVSSNTFASAPSSYTFAYDPTATYTLTPAFLTTTLNTGSNVVLQANNDITISSAVTASNGSGNGGNLTLQAGRSILINANITTDDGNLALYANEKASTGVVDANRSSGTAVITMAGGTTLNAGAGTVDIRLDNGLGNTYTAGGDITLVTVTGAATTITNNNASGGGSTAGALTLGSLTLNTQGTFTLGAALNVTNDLIITAGTLDVSPANCSGAACAITVGGNWSNSGTFVPETGTVTFNGTASGKTITTGGSTFNNIAINGTGGAWALQGTNVTVSGNVAISAGTLTSCSGTLSVGGNWLQAGGTFTHNSGTVDFNGSGTQDVSLGSSSFNNFTHSGSSTLYSWAYKKAVTIDYTKVSSDQTNFPVLLYINGDADLYAHAQSAGQDLVFMDASGTRLTHEIEYYSRGGSSDTAYVWVKVPTLSSTADTTLYMNYGNPTCASQQNATGVWSNGYTAVYHLPNGTSLTANDSLGVNNGTVSGATATPGEIDGGGNFVSSSSQYINMGTGSSIADLVNTSGSGSVAWSFWINPTTNTSGTIAARNDGNTVSPGWWISFETGPLLRFTTERATTNARKQITAPSTGAWSYVVIEGDTHSINPTMTIYVNGVSQAVSSANTGVGTSGSDSSQTFYVGRYGAAVGGGNGFLNGILDEFRVSTTARSTGWVLTEYNNQSDQTMGSGHFVKSIGAESTNSLSAAGNLINSNGTAIAGSANISVGGSLTASGGTLAIGNKDLAVTGNSTVTGGTVTIGTSAVNGWTTADMTIGTGGTVTCSGNSKITASGNWDSSAGTFTPTSGTVYLTGTGNLSPGANNNFINLSITGSGTYTTTTTLNVGTSGVGTLTVSGATLTLDNATNLTGGVDNFVNIATTLKGNAGLLITPSANVNLPALTRDGTGRVYFQSYGATAKTITMTGNWNLAGDLYVGYWNSQGSISPMTLNTGGNSLTVNNLKLASGTGTDIGKLDLSTGTPAITINGSFSAVYGDNTINTANLGATNISIKGDWDTTKIGITPGTSAVTFNGTGTQNITSNGQLFNILTVTNASSGGVTFADQLQTAILNDITNASTLKFAAASLASPHTISTTLNISGGAGTNNITLAPSSAAVTWYILAPASTTVTNAIVSYSYAKTNHIIPSGCTDLVPGSNTNWDFDTTPPSLVSPPGVSPATLIYDNSAPTVDIANVGTCTDSGSGLNAAPYQISYSDVGTSPGTGCSGKSYTIITTWSTTHSASFIGTDGHYYCMKLECKDVANNSTAYYSANNILYDITAPTNSIGAPSASLTNTGPITYTITYGGADSISLVAGNVTLNKTGSADGSVAVSGSGTATRTVTISSITGDGTLGISIAAATASDNAGNTSLGAGPSTAFTVDNTAPNITGLSDDSTPAKSKTWTWSSSDGTATFRYLVDQTIGSSPSGSYDSTITVTQSSGNGTYYIHVQAIDPVGNPSSVTTVSAVLDNTAPTVSGVTSPLDNGNYTINQIVPVQVSFSEDVIVSGIPQLILSTSSPSTTAVDYLSGSGTNTITFNYTVASGNASTDLDYTSTTALVLNGGTIKDAVGNNAILTLASPGSTNSLGANKALVIDTTGPTLSFSNNVAAGPVISDTVTGSWGDASVKKWEYDADGVCPVSAGSYSKTDSDSINQTTVDNNTKYICLYGEDVAGNSATTASAYDINIDVTPPTLSLVADSASQITVTWTAYSNPTGTEYYGENTTDSTNSGWITTTTWISSGLVCNTSYTFTVKAKNGGAETAMSTSSVTTAGCPGGGSLPVGAYLPPSAPLTGFLVQINNGAMTTNTQDVALTLRGSSDTFRMSVSNDPNFTNAIQESYAITKQWRLSDGQGQKTVYVKFFTTYGVSSDTITATINYRIPNILTPIIDIINPPTPPITPIEPPIPPQPPVEEVVPQKAPDALSNIWDTMPTKSIERFVLQPLPKELRVLAGKFPQLDKALTEIGITKITDVEKLYGNSLSLSGLSQAIEQNVRLSGLGSPLVDPKDFTLPQGVSLDHLTLQLKERVPTDILFVRSGSGTVDKETSITMGDQGEIQQKVSVMAGKDVQLIIKPEGSVKTIKGYLIFKQKGKKETTESILKKTAASLLSPALTDGGENLEQALVVKEFYYEDADGDGIWTANVSMPVVDGEYEIISVMEYNNIKLLPKELKLVTVIDPEGYIYYQTSQGKMRIEGAKASLFWLNPETREYELWPAKNYQQINPQITDDTGRYAFLAPQGTYQLLVEAKGYSPYRGESIEVVWGNEIHQNIGLEKSFWLLRYFDWKAGIILVIVILLAINFYRDRIRELINKKGKNTP